MQLESESERDGEGEMHKGRRRASKDVLVSMATQLSGERRRRGTDMSFHHT